jgi:hypothetical protein
MASLGARNHGGTCRGNVQTFMIHSSLLPPSSRADPLGFQSQAKGQSLRGMSYEQSRYLASRNVGLNGKARVMMCGSMPHLHRGCPEAIWYRELMQHRHGVRCLTEHVRSRGNRKCCTEAWSQEHDVEQALEHYLAQALQRPRHEPQTEQMEPPLVPEGGKLQRGLMAVQPRAWLRLTYRAANQRYGTGRDMAFHRPSGRLRAVLRETKWVDGHERHFCRTCAGGFAMERPSNPHYSRPTTPPTAVEIGSGHLM